MAYLNVFINNSNKNPINVNRDTKPVPPGPGIEKTVITENGYSILLENDGLILTEII
jgi:hypothetical protein